MANPLHIIPVTCCVENNGKYLIIKRKQKEGEFGGKWVFPGGKVEVGENLIKTLFREIKEEVNIDLQDEIAMIRTYGYVRNDGHHSVGVVFAAKYKSGDVSLDADTDDHAWIHPDDYLSYDIIPGSEYHLRNAVEFIEQGLLYHKDKLYRT